MRRDAREAVYKILYADLFYENDDEFEKETMEESSLSKDDEEFANALLSAIKEHKSELEEIIGKHARGYSFERIFSTDKCALYIAVAEIKYFDDIPTVVSIDEALSLVRKYSTEESLNFVNGILASVKKEQEA
jgi:transcription antitermination factor nusB